MAIAKTHIVLALKWASVTFVCWAVAATLALFKSDNKPQASNKHTSEWQALSFAKPQPEMKIFLQANLWGVTERSRFSDLLADSEKRDITLADEYKDYSLVGIVQSADQRLALLLDPSGIVERVSLGEALSDGQVMDAIEEDSINLSAGGQPQALRLFEYKDTEKQQ